MTGEVVELGGSLGRWKCAHEENRYTSPKTRANVFPSGDFYRRDGGPLPGVEASRPARERALCLSKAQDHSSKSVSCVLDGVTGSARWDSSRSISSTWRRSCSLVISAGFVAFLACSAAFGGT